VYTGNRIVGSNPTPSAKRPSTTIAHALAISEQTDI
jgi:hypothetical protein